MINQCHYSLYFKLFCNFRKRQLRAALADACEASGDLDEALALCTGLVLTAPEYHLM